MKAQGIIKKYAKTKDTIGLSIDQARAYGVFYKDLYLMIGV